MKKVYCIVILSILAAPRSSTTPCAIGRARHDVPRAWTFDSPEALYIVHGSGRARRLQARRPS